MDMGGGSGFIIVILGPIILAAVLLWALLRNRASRRERDRSEGATRDLYRQENEAHRGEDDDVP